MSDDRTLTWAGLLARWTDFARAGLALPATAEGDRWKGAIPPIIGLQAIIHALSELHDLPDPGERAAGLDRAAVLITRHARELHTLWTGQELPEELAELVSDARHAHAAASAGGLEWTATAEQTAFDHPGALAAALVAAGFDGDLFLPSPGVPMHAGTPVGFLRARVGGAPDDEIVEVVDAFLAAGEASGPEAVAGPRQTYRQFDFGSGGPVRDLVVPLEGEPRPGQPLLVAAVLEGEPLPVSLPPRASGPLPILPVVSDDDGD